VTSFSDLCLIEPLQRALRSENYQTPTPIQAQAIPHLLAGRDLLGIAQTGTGKTAAFALPILQRLAETRVAPTPRTARALILTPTRELALQISDSLRAYGRHLNLRHAVVFGGVGQKPQVDALARGVDILVATPGRLLDLMGQRHLRFDGLSVFVLDEADRMLDMGFIHDVKRIIATLPKARHTLLFSATMPADIARLADSILKAPIRVEVAPAATTVERVEQRVLFVDGAQKRALLIDLLRDPGITRALVFARTKHGADRITKELARANVQAAAIHGNKSQSARQHALESFRTGRLRVLVATDIAARGIDIDDVSHVINYDLPNVPESYVHRIGRTARAGADGIALSFCSTEEREFLRDIEKLTRRKLSVVETHAYARRDSRPPAPAAPAAAKPPRNDHGAGRRRRPQRRAGARARYG
jgi:ATP-dependent RNA helicase RhlE